ncbi:MAG TPA: DUF885 domain-containing protein [Vicinamibacterales bacterium]|nr:DUF885 domain-containing protein [Vicinamibacterales bacterium]
MNRNPLAWLVARTATAAAALIVALGTPTFGRQAAQGEAVKLQTVVDEYLAQRGGGPGGGALGRSVSPDRNAALSLARAREQAAWADGLLKKVHSVRAEELGHDDWLTYSVLEFELGLASQADRYFWLTIPITPYSSPLRSITTPFEGFQFRSLDDLDTYIDALHQVPVLMATYEAKLRSQMVRGIVVPVEELRLAIPFLRTFVGNAPQSRFNVETKRLGSLQAEAVAAFRQRLDDAIRLVVNPSIERLIAFVDGPYRTRAPPGVGLVQYPEGLAYYNFLIRQHTGLELTATQIHQIGLDEVARLNGELDKVRLASGFKGSLGEFRTFLKTDRRFFPKSADEFGEAMMAAIRRIEPKIDSFFTKQPKAPYGVKRLDEALEQSMTYGYYQIPTASEPMGYYRFNGSQPESRSLLFAPALIYHELVPGHHFQLGLRRESTTLSPFRRGQMHTAFTEGWAEYSSDLAGELGMYEGDPYARAGRLAMDLFLSTRLVVDTGINALGWSRERAMTFMRENTLESDVQIDTESLRYSSDMPGQALAYKLGAMKIHELRRQVRQTQGASFDIRRFHDHLLDHGSMPLGVLEQHVACYLREQHKGR